MLAPKDFLRFFSRPTTKNSLPYPQTIAGKEVAAYDAVRGSLKSRGRGTVSRNRLQALAPIPLGGLRVGDGDIKSASQAMGTEKHTPEDSNL
jgi:hypothetical protein